MEEMMQQYDVMGDFHRGKVVEGTIVDTQEDGWLVDVGYKCEGFLRARSGPTACSWRRLPSRRTAIRSASR